MVSRNVAGTVFGLGIAGILVYLCIDDPKKVEPPIRFPGLQESFCSVVERASSSYQKLSGQLESATQARNGIAGEQFAHKMTSIYEGRNADVFQLLRQADFTFHGWIVTVNKIDAPDGDRIRFDISPACSPRTAVHARAAAEPKNITFLSQLQQGSQIRVDGKFVERWGGKAGGQPGKPVSADAFEGSFTERGSMEEPEYSAVVLTME